uniref:Outer membrane protein beta-barrel domain-containing protein n=1 Tax=candidate division WOR-3 bacterium TaxID=2052148 RepID=A0A7V3RHA8_UNCW3
MKEIILCMLILNTGFSKSIDIVPRPKEDEVLIKGPVDKGGFGGFVIKFTEINDEFGLLMGGRGGVTFNHIFGIGGGIYGLVNRMEVSTNYQIRNFNMDFAYGGLILEIVFRSRKLIHFGTHMLIGGGSVEYKLPPYEEPWYDDFFFVLEPSAELTLNMTKVFRMDLGGSYRYIYGSELDGISDQGLSGPCGYITFKFGKF